MSDRYDRRREIRRPAEPRVGDRFSILDRGQARGMYTRAELTPAKLLELLGKVLFHGPLFCLSPPFSGAKTV